MRFSTQFGAATLSLVLAALAAAEGQSGPSDVLELTSENFTSTVNAEPLMLLEFFAPWCGHCKALAPHYEESATALKDKGIKLAKVDCVDQADLCQEHGVQGYPTLKVSRKGDFTDYNGPRQAPGIISYMTKQSLPAVSQVSAADLDTFKTSDKIVAVAYVTSTTDAPAPAFSVAAEKNRDDYLFGIVSDKEAAEAAGVTPPAIVLYRKFDEEETPYPYPVPATTPEELEGWIKELSIPVIDEVGAENYGTYAQSGKPLAYLFLDPTAEGKDEQIAAIRPIAAKYRGKINFVWIDAVKFGDHAKALNLHEAKWPSFVIQDLSQQLKYPYSQAKEVIPSDVDKMAEDYLAGKLEPELKSQAIPETQDESTITLVGKQFDEIVFDDSKDVFVEFYAPWCGHCKRLKPTWDSLGDHFASVKDSLVIAKMDATENDIPPSAPFRIQGFPTLKFKPAGTKDFIDYDGDRSLESLIEFVQEHSKNKLDVKPAPVSNETTPEPSVAADSKPHDEL